MWVARNGMKGVEKFVKYADLIFLSHSCCLFFFALGTWVMATFKVISVKIQMIFKKEKGLFFFFVGGLHSLLIAAAIGIRLLLMVIAVNCSQKPLWLAG